MLNGSRVEVVHGSLKFEYHEEREAGGALVGGGERERGARGRGWLLEGGLVWAMFVPGHHNCDYIATLGAAMQGTCVIGSGSTRPLTLELSSMIKQEVDRASRGLQRKAAGAARVHPSPNRCSTTGNEAHMWLLSGECVVAARGS
jgi:hypothetical protein